MAPRALLFDAAGTLLHLAEPVGRTYARLGRPFGVTRPPAEIELGFRRFFGAPWPGLRMEGDGRPFWRAAVLAATGVESPEMFEILYAHYGRAPAWTLAEGALEGLTALRQAGIKVAVLSNWDNRLRGLLGSLGLLERVDLALISGEVGLEKPDPRIFALACGALEVRPAEALHIGDDPIADGEGARAAGLGFLRWGVDLRRFEEVEGICAVGAHLPK